MTKCFSLPVVCDFWSKKGKSASLSHSASLGHSPTQTRDQLGPLVYNTQTTVKEAALSGWNLNNGASLEKQMKPTGDLLRGSTDRQVGVMGEGGWG